MCKCLGSGVMGWRPRVDDVLLFCDMVGIEPRSPAWQVGTLTTILKRKRLLPAKSLSSTWSNVPPMSGNTTHSQVPGNVGSRKGVARRLLHGDLLSPWGHGCCEERQDLSFVAGYLSWLERGANNAKVAGSIPVLAILDIERWRRSTLFLTIVRTPFSSAV